jgi:methylase of polypeptide subunit release factors
VEHHPDEPRLTFAVWNEDGAERRARWRSSTSPRPPRRILVVADDLSADRAVRLARSGTALLWRGDHRNARQVLDAMKRRLARFETTREQPPTEAFREHRRAMAYRARVAGALLVELDADYRIRLAHAPDVQAACQEAYGPADGPSVVPLQELLGVVGASQWRRRGIEVAAIGARIHPHYGVFAPTREDYVGLVGRAPLASVATAFDIGTGTGVLAAILARRGVPRVVATDVNPAAVTCAQENLARLGLDGQVTVRRMNLFPPGRADLVVCNPPWVPGRPVSALEAGVLDEGGRMLRGFVLGLSDHLADGGEAWLVLSDLAELLGLRTRAELLDLVERAGLTVRDRLDAPPAPRPRRTGDVLAAARARETVSLWRLAR